MAKRVRKITPDFLKKIIIDEARKLRLETLEQGKEEVETVDADEVEADDFASTLEKELDFIKALKIKENRLVKSLKKIRERKNRIRRKIQKRI
jgi:DNA polymerase III delta prime subunit|tara:strand:+ start:321 stop:599 length:279 start_codon:yes stop_codon:yes gene_type:complete